MKVIDKKYWQEMIEKKAKRSKEKEKSREASERKKNYLLKLQGNDTEDNDNKPRKLVENESNSSHWEQLLMVITSLIIGRSKVNIEIKPSKYCKNIQSDRHGKGISYLNVYRNSSREYAAGGEMIKLLENGGLPDDTCRKYFRQLVSAIEHIHSSNVVHRDLKLENLLLNENQDLLLSDFGLGRTFDNNGPDLYMSVYYS